MADNYLEKRMADYRAGRAAGPVRLAGRRPGTAVIKYAPRTVLLYHPAPDFAPDIIDIFAAASCKVVVVAAADPAPGRGARFYSAAIESALADIDARGEAIDVVIAHTLEPWMRGRRVILLNAADDATDADATDADVATTDVAAAAEVLSLQGTDPRRAAILCLAFAAVEAAIQGQNIVF